jgi:hypothetical protein
MSDEDIDLIFFDVDHSATMDDEQLSLVHETAPRFWKQRDGIQLGHRKALRCPFCHRRYLLLSTIFESNWYLTYILYLYRRTLSPMCIHSRYRHKYLYIARQLRLCCRH